METPNRMSLFMVAPFAGKVARSCLKGKYRQRIQECRKIADPNVQKH